jgi:multidrug resistance efflux pump
MDVKKLSELTDSRLLYDKKVPPFGYYLIFVVLLLLLATFIWSFFSIKVFIVKGSGKVESDNKNLIMSAYSGKIKDIFFKNGDYIEKGDTILSIESTDLDLQLIQVNGKIAIFEKQIENLKLLEKSIIDDVNYFSGTNIEDSEYYNQFEAYKSQIKQNEIDVSVYESYGYTDSQIQAEVEKSEGKISEIYYSTLKSISENISNDKAELENLTLQKDAINDGQSDYNLQANENGTIFFTEELKEGMVIQAGNTLGSVAQENGRYQIIAYINANDAPRVNVGDSVDVVVNGLLESVYGTINGELIQIDSDITSGQSTNEQGTTSTNSYFRVTIQIDNDYLVSKSGRKFNLTNGTTVEIRIKYEEISYFEYLMEALGLLSR